MRNESTTPIEASQSFKPTPAQVVSRMLLRRDVRVELRTGCRYVVAGTNAVEHAPTEEGGAIRVDHLRRVFEPLLLEAFEAGRLSVLGDLSERVAEIPTGTPCPICPGPTEHAGEICDDCAAYVGMVR